MAALFALHPLRVESVAWIAGRKDVLSGLFGLLALLAYTRYAQAQCATRKVPHFLVSRSYWLAWFWFALGLMSETHAGDVAICVVAIGLLAAQAIFDLPACAGPRPDE